MPQHYTIRGLVIGAVFCLALAAGAQLAPKDAQARPEQAAHAAAARFAAMDADKDGALSREEFFAAQPQMKDAAFDAIDADKDGRITMREWEGFVAGHGKSEPHAADECMPMPHEGGTGDGTGQEGTGQTGAKPGAAGPPPLMTPPAAASE